MIRLLRVHFLQNYVMWGLVLMVLVAAFFRFYRLLDLQYYSWDDEFTATIMRQIVVDKRLVLLTPAPTLGISLGSFWYWMSAPVFALANFNPVYTSIFGSMVGIGSAIFLYIAGRQLGNPRVGLLAGFLYGGSFVMSLADRRWWTLSLNPFLVTLALVSLRKIIQGKYRFSFPLALAASFAWHADLTLGLISLVTMICIVVFKIPLWRKGYMFALVWIVFSLLPFAVFEVRHPGTVTGPVIKMVTRFQQPKAGNMIDVLDLKEISIGTSRSLFAVPTSSIEEYMYPHSGNGMIDNPWFVKIITLVLMGFPLGLFYSKHYVTKRISLMLLYIFLGCFYLGIWLVNFFGKTSITHSYYTVLWPVVYLLSAFTLDWLVTKRQFLLVLLFGAIFLMANVAALFGSEMRYQLIDKMMLVNQVAGNLSTQPFSLYPLTDIHLYGGGLGGIFLMHNRFPSNRNYYGFDWFYQAFSLYELPIVDKDTFEQVVVIYPAQDNPDWLDYSPATPMQTFETRHMKATILRTGDN